MKNNQKGFTLTEVLIALAIFGIVGTSVMLALNASSKTIVSAHEITVAESLTRTIVEYVKRSAYDSVDYSVAPPQYAMYDSRSGDAAGDYDTLLGLDGDPYYNDYTVNVYIEPIDTDGDVTDDDGIQEITVEVRYDDTRTVLITEAYKVNR